MKKSFMTRVLAVSLSAAMAFSVSSASNLMTASAASTVNLKTTFKTLKVNQKYKMTLKNNTLNWKITKVQTSNKKICTVYGKTSSYVMLKGKGVGRAKITVTVKTTKRKKNNVKKMKCTANVKAAAVEETFSASAVANSNTEVKVNFTQAVDAAAAENFTVSDGVTVSEAKLSDDKKSVVLTVAGAEYGKNYDLTVTGIKVAGKAQADQKLTFTTPAATDKYPMTLEAKDPILKSDGQSQTVVTFTIKDENGNLIKDKGVEVAFATSLGKFAEQRVSIQDGVATNMFTSEALMQTQTAQITATVVESTENKELLGLNTTASITLTPNPEDMNTAVGAIITSATAPTADRIIAYFNQKVDAKDFLTKTNKIDHSKFACEVSSGLDNGSEGGGREQQHTVVGVLPVEGADNALQLLVSTPMVDNSNIKVKFTNKTATDTLVTAENTVFCKLTDARQPSVLNVKSNGLREIKVEFSEAMLSRSYCDGFNDGWDDKDAEKRYAADTIDNYLIDGRPLSDWVATVNGPGEESSDETDGNVKILSSKDDQPAGNNGGKGTIQIGRYDSGKDERHIVTIKLGTENYLTPGTHRLSVANVGDWAAKTDKERNIVNTQGFDFVVEENDVVPTFTVEPQSPEQYKVTFNSDIDLVSKSETLKTPNSVTSGYPSVMQLQQNIGGTWTTISDGEGSGKNPIRVSKISNEANAYIIEVTRDWTEVYNTTGTRMNYFNYDLRLHMDAGKVVNVSNNKQNSEINVPLTGDIMKTPDTVSPVIGDVVQAEDKSGNPLESYNVTLSEPVKLSDGSGTSNGANGEGLTPSQTQQANSKSDGRLGVPAPSAQFIRTDNGETVDGIISESAFIDAADTIINVEPSATLAAGEWRLVLSSISDDYGNTASTVTHTINVTRETAATNFRIVWAAVSEDPEYKLDKIGNGQKGRYIFVKFNKPITLTGNSTNAQVTGNYTINGSTLPTGTQIYAKIKGYDDLKGTATDSITIALPQGSFSGNWDYSVDSLNAMLNVSRAITATTGENLSNGGMIRLPFQFGSATKEEGVSQIASLTTKTDAVWGNDASEQRDNFTSLKAYYEALKAALENDKYRKVLFSEELDLIDGKEAIAVFGKGRTLTIKRAVDIDLQGHNIKGNVAVTTSDIVKSMTIEGSNAQISGYSGNKQNTATLTVNAGTIADFTISGVTVNAAGEGNAININDTYIDTFKNSAIVNGNVLITDSNGGGFDNGAVGQINGELALTTKGRIKLSGNLSNVSEGVFVRDAAIVDFTKDAKMKNTEINVSASDARIIIDKNADADGSTVITAAAKNVRITIPKELAAIKCQETTTGSFKAVDENNKDVSSSDPNVVTPQADKTPAAKLLQEINVLEATRVADYKEEVVTITRGAISVSDGGLNITKLKETVETTIADEKNNITVKATYALQSQNGVQISNGVITVKDEKASAKDRVRVTLEAVIDGKVVDTMVKWIDIIKE